MHCGRRLFIHESGKLAGDGHETPREEKLVDVDIALPTMLEKRYGRERHELRTAERSVQPLVNVGVGGGKKDRAVPKSPRSIFHSATEPAHHLSIGEGRSEEHTSELQSRPHIVCRLLLEKKLTQLVDMD